MAIEEMRIDYQVNHTAGANPYAVLYNGETLIASNVVSRYLIYNYGSFLCSDLYTKFELYNAMQAADLKRALTAWNADYNPLENYNGEIERVTLDNHGKETRKHTTGGEGGTHKTVTVEAKSGTATTHYTTTYDSQTPRTEYKDENTGGNITTDDLHTQDTTERENKALTVGETTYTADDVHSETEKKHGNLGVTTSQQMIESEVEMRLNPVTKQYLDRFVFQYAMYVGGGFERWY